MRCEDCGCSLRNGICTNCNEELYIHDHQTDGDYEFSDEFMDKVSEQRSKIKYPIRDVSEYPETFDEPLHPDTDCIHDMEYSQTLGLVGGKCKKCGYKTF